MMGLDKKLVLIALAGESGLARYGLAGLVQRWADRIRLGNAGGQPGGLLLFGMIWSPPRSGC